MGIVVFPFIGLWGILLIFIFFEERHLHDAFWVIVANIFVGCLFFMALDICEKSVNWKFLPEVEDEQAAKEFGVYVADYRLADTLLFDSVPIKGRGFAIQNSQYTSHKSKREILVDSRWIDYVMDMEEGDKIEKMLDDKGLCIPSSRIIVKNGSHVLEHIYGDAYRDTIYMTIHLDSIRWERVDSVMFVRDGETNLRYYAPEKREEFILTRHRSLKDRIKDWFFVDEIKAYLTRKK